MAESYYQRHKTRLKAKSNARYHAKKQEIRAQQNAYAREHRKEAQDRQQVWRAANPERYRAQARDLYAKSPARRATIKLYNARRRSPGLKCSCCSADLFRPVYYAAELINGEVDHVLALSLGGIHCVKNLQILSREEHKEKTKRDLTAARRLRATKN